MSKKTVVVVGAGALGSHFVQFFRNVDANVKLIDFDRVEAKNVLSQFHAKTSVGKSKVQSLKGQMALLFGTNINVVPHKLTQENVNTLLEGADLLVDCTDNAEARVLLRTRASAAGIPCLHGALAANGAFGRVIWSERFIIDSEAGVGGATCEDGEHLPFIGIVGAYLARAAQEFLSNNKKIGFEINAGGALRV